MGKVIVEFSAPGSSGANNGAPLRTIHCTKATVSRVAGSRTTNRGGAGKISVVGVSAVKSASIADH